MKLLLWTIIAMGTLFYLPSPVEAACGDVDGSGAIDMGDLVYLVDYLHAGGPVPSVLADADVDGCDGINDGDLVYLLNYAVNFGPYPCEGPECTITEMGSVTLDHVDGMTGGGLAIGTTNTFVVNLNYTSTPSQPDLGDIICGFRVYSPTGAQWTMTTPRYTNALPPEQFDFIFEVGGTSQDGMGADTVTFYAMAMTSQGLPYGYDDTALAIEIGPIDPSFEGGIICLDSSWMPPGGDWLWVAGSGELLIPSWDGPHCFSIGETSNEPPICDTSSVTMLRFAAHEDSSYVYLDAWDPDSTGPLSYEIIDISPPPIGSVTIDPVEGALVFNMDPSDPDTVYTVTFSVSDGISTETCERKVLLYDNLHTVQSLYDSASYYQGQQVFLIGCYTDTADHMYLANYLDYLSTEVDSLRNFLVGAGEIPTEELRSGKLLLSRGTVSYEIDTSTGFDADTALITFYADWHEPVSDDTSFNDPTTPIDTANGNPEDGGKFAILISGGYSNKSNQATLWKELVEVYKSLKKQGYKPVNIKTFYYDGTPSNNSIPNNAQFNAARLGNLTNKPGIHKAFVDCAAGIKAYLNANSEKPTEFTLYIGTHGSKAFGAALLKGDLGKEEYLPDLVKADVAKIIAAKVKNINVQMSLCFGGRIAEKVNELSTAWPNGAGNTCLRVNSSATGVTSAFFPFHVMSLVSAMDILNNRAESYDIAVSFALMNYYEGLVETEKDAKKIVKQNETLVRIVGAKAKPKMQKYLDRANKKLDDIIALRANGLPAWKTVTFQKYTDKEEFSVQLFPTVDFAKAKRKIEFKFIDNPALTSCANVSLWTSNKKRQSVWNWNNPRSTGFTVGNDVRTHNLPNASDGVFNLVNDNSKHTVRGYMLLWKQGNKSFLEDPDSPSNIKEYGGFSMGGADGSSAEFGDGISGSLVELYDANQLGFDLNWHPQRLDYSGASGVAELKIHFPIDSSTVYWDSMEVRLYIDSIESAGELMLAVDGATFDTVIVPLSTADTGVHSIFVGAVPSGSSGSLTFVALSGLGFRFDSWGLKSLVPSGPESCCVGSRGNVDFDYGDMIDISDLVYLVDYMFSGGPPPPCPEEADIDGSGGIDISDLVYLVDYMFTGGPPPTSCP